MPTRRHKPRTLRRRPHAHPPVVVSAGGAERRILEVRGFRVMLDRDLAEIYGVRIAALNQAVRRNPARFPPDFRFRLTADEWASLRSQSVTVGARDAPAARPGARPSRRGLHRKYLPYAFTEQGVAMLSSVLRSPRAVAVNIEIMRAFVRLRAMLASNADLLRKVEALEAKYEGQFRAVFDAIKALMEPPPDAEHDGPPKPRIGFRGS